MILKAKDIAKMNKEDLKHKMKELRIELIKTKANSKKSGKMNKREIMKAIARILTIKRMNEIKSLKERKMQSKEKKIGGKI